MGQALLDMYKKVEQVGQLKAKMRMAMLTGVSSTKAVSEPDTPEIIAKFETAMVEIEREFK
jgi:tellurite resistance protein